ncbi:MAG: cupin domain-containing protein [Rhizobiaceae bacterium]|nr:cupin domain-containing protein [Rhizobiaceae bacterium]
MSELYPAEVLINSATGAVSPATGRYAKHLSELGGIFSNADAWSRTIREENDPLIYEVLEYKQEGSDLFFGTTTMQPGKIGDEFYMTRGHFHEDRTKGEVYNTLSGQGLLLLEDRQGRSSTIEMREGSSAFIPPDWAHRSINCGPAPLVFTWFCSVAAGHDYGQILQQGMRKLVIERNGEIEVVANPKFD